VEIAPGIRRIGPGLANVYLFEEAGAVTIVDAGMPGYWHALPAELVDPHSAWRADPRSRA